MAWEDSRQDEVEWVVDGNAMRHLLQGCASAGGTPTSVGPDSIIIVEKAR